MNNPKENAEVVPIKYKIDKITKLIIKTTETKLSSHYKKVMSWNV